MPWPWFAALWIAWTAVWLVAFRVIRRRRISRDRDFIETAAMFARAHGGWPCRDCIRDGRAGPGDQDDATCRVCSL